MFGNTAICSKQVRDLYREFSAVLAVAAEGRPQSASRRFIIAADKQVFSVGEGGADVLVGRAIAFQAFLKRCS